MTSTNILCCLLIISVSITKIMATNSTESQNVKSIKTIYGDVYDCVDFYEQPAFKHPRLKNHNYNPEMRPTFLPNITTAINDAEISRIQVFENGGCPIGNVPIKKLSKEDHYPSSMFSETYIDVSTNKQTVPSGTHFAILQTKASPNPTHYYGVGARFSVWNPQVKENQYSAARISIQNGPESLQVGWMVNPTMYKDTKTHMFIHTNTPESQCFNTYCSGFVLVRSDIPPDVTIVGYSVRGKLVEYFRFFIYRETVSGDWWLLVADDLTPIGFWPAKIFNNLNKFGTYISCGGETYSPPTKSGGLPPMGSGMYPVKVAKQDAFGEIFETVNEKLQRITVDDQDLERFVDTEKYIVTDVFRGKIYFGGYGG